MSEEIKPNSNHLDAVFKAENDQDHVEASNALNALRAASAPSFIVPKEQTIPNPVIDPKIKIVPNVTSQPDKQ